jgi:ribosomal protein L31E
LAFLILYIPIDAKEITEGKFKQLCSDYSIPCTLAEPYSPWQNRAESNIRELKWHVGKKMKARNVLKAL